MRPRTARSLVASVNPLRLQTYKYFWLALRMRVCNHTSNAASEQTAACSFKTATALARACRTDLSEFCQLAWHHRPVAAPTSQPSPGEPVALRLALLAVLPGLRLRAGDGGARLDFDGSTLPAPPPPQLAAALLASLAGIGSWNAGAGPPGIVALPLHDDQSGIAAPTLAPQAEALDEYNENGGSYDCCAAIDTVDAGQKGTLWSSDACNASAAPDNTVPSPPPAAIAAARADRPPLAVLAAVTAATAAPAVLRIAR
ncbi:hypothetical protein VOLCADRAFT_95684 [Volvox carteri f. nagariensis]|uniref:Uncharacterized protein n=1 Tax=Volvox carteri f. nagariensis TaxID=3068 RepID=D8U843_VOLCA|nr:uncharacterized protein VOLCADRAFT_95684 [Volvox carteri f. nagariensis]EFJ44077.1 hypothetical protein VOLCADRAFT_95684 [Volvox carteri f. nagariensis]|eukprot:XP_002954878.1 hypothetical protein VOLCADRAFT_95684 [Volvox carteri f. nagariensis]